MVGKVEKSSGRLIKRTVIIIITENVTEMDNPKSNMKVGIGTNKNMKMNMIPTASATSLRNIPRPAPRACPMKLEDEPDVLDMIIKYAQTISARVLKNNAKDGLV